MPSAVSALRLDLHEDLPRDLAVDVDARDTRDVLEPLDDRLVGQRGELAQVGAVGDMTASETTGSWFSVVGAHHQRILDVARERRAHHARPCRARPASRAIMSVSRRNSTNTELVPSRGERAHEPHARHAVDRVLDRAGDVDLHRLGRRAGVLRLDDDERQRHVGHLLHAQPRIREDAEHRERDHHHGREDGVVDRDAGDPHFRNQKSDVR